MKTKLILLIFSLALLAMGTSVRAQYILEGYLVFGAENNPGLKAKFQEYQSALEKVPQASSLPDPLFTFGYFVSPVETRVGPQRAKFSLTQALPWFGTLNARKSAAEAGAEVKFESFIKSRNDYFLKVRLAYYDLYELEQSIRVSEENLEILNTREKVVLKKYEGGLASMVDVLRVQMMITERATNIQILKEDRKYQKEMFNLLLNKEATERVEVDFQLLFPETDYLINRDSLSRNPAITMIEAQKNAERKLLEVDKFASKPNIGFGLDYVAVGPAISDIPGSGKDVLMPMVNLSLPIYGKKNKSRIRERELKLESLDSYRQDLQNKLESELSSAHNAYEDSERKFVLYIELTEKADQALRVLLTEYASANKGFEEVLRMQQLLLEYELALEKSVVKRFKAEARLNFIFNK